MDGESGARGKGREREIKKEIKSNVRSEILGPEW